MNEDIFFIDRFCGLKHIHSMQKTLNQLDPDIYPHLWYVKIFFHICCLDLVS